mmetsp:Transcript_4884/g.11437  ORF Transcript_4884/g.11437 Transcript_4884/m.11437 type:complete len:208 (+) Transcript_4884:1173-1796(+)
MRLHTASSRAQRGGVFLRPSPATTRIVCTCINSSMRFPGTLGVRVILSAMDTFATPVNCLSSSEPGLSSGPQKRLLSANRSFATGPTLPSPTRVTLTEMESLWVTLFGLHLIRQGSTTCALTWCRSRTLPSMASGVTSGIHLIGMMRMLHSYEESRHRILMAPWLRFVLGSCPRCRWGALPSFPQQSFMRDVRTWEFGDRSGRRTLA